ncbi:hypothetical protein CVV68_09395 [Arthrobacter livingstonensis]|uniref:Acyl-CoA dehydrogenase/oxidase C-terminal domain-containing protein n=1 Tax=Arthrobacter livingstonensis TaxID=670078 RepID=A0A2V5LCU2_9MICC|nr:acyl-CoA dehydrogenase family protein [Arthrobacter livingstonensis]PYI67643.1 hypothetical protein CVV68_09395 [Arthrobacter livingstonensis]
MRAGQTVTREVINARTMFNHSTNQIHYPSMRMSASAHIAEVDIGVRNVLEALNAERILLVSAAVHYWHWLTHHAPEPANGREVFGREIGYNQSVRFPIADAYMTIRATDLMCFKAAWIFDTVQPFGTEANLVEQLALEASCHQAANAARDTHGSHGFVDKYDIERIFRETRIFQVPRSTTK